MGDTMYKIVSNLTQIKCDKAPVLDDEGKQVYEPIGCLLGSFRWPASGVIVPDDFFADDAVFIRMVAFPGLDVYKGDEEKGWTLLEMEDVDEAGGASPSARPAPSPEAIRDAAERGIRVTPRTAPRAQPRGPLNEVPASKVREHLESITTAQTVTRKRGRPRVNG